MIDENKKELDFNNDKRFHTDAEYHASMIMPYIQTSQFIFETLNLEYYYTNNNNIAIKNTSKRKDRFSSVAYCNFLAELIEQEEYKKRKNKKSGYIFLK